MTLMPDSSNNPSALNADIPCAGRLLSDPPGGVLKRARQARKLDLETAADQLNLSAQVVRALEEDAYEKLPSPTFIRGYIRVYARLLKLSGDDLVRSYERIVMMQQLEPQETAEVAKVKPQKIKKGWIVLGLLVVIAAAIGFIVTSEDVTNNVEPEIDSEADVRPVSEIGGLDGIVESVSAGGIAESAAAESVADAVVPIGFTTAEKIAPTIELIIEPKNVKSVDDPVVEVPEAVVEIVVEPETTAVEAVSESIAELEVDTPVKVEVPQQNEIETTQVDLELSTLTMTFSGECWVEVWDATGKRIYANLRNAGQRVSLQGAAPIEVKLGDGAMVKLEFNGSPVLFASSKRTSVAHVTLGE